MPFALWARFIRKVRASLVSERRSAQRPGCCLRLEQLEERALLSGGNHVPNLGGPPVTTALADLPPAIVSGPSSSSPGGPGGGGPGGGNAGFFSSGPGYPLLPVSLQPQFNGSSGGPGSSAAIGVPPSVVVVPVLPPPGNIPMNSSSPGGPSSTATVVPPSNSGPPPAPVPVLVAGVIVPPAVPR